MANYSVLIEAIIPAETEEDAKAVAELACQEMVHTALAAAAQLYAKDGSVVNMDSLSK